MHNPNYAKANRGTLLLGNGASLYRSASSSAPRKKARSAKRFRFLYRLVACHDVPRAPLFHCPIVPLSPTANRQFYNYRPHPAITELSHRHDLTSIYQ